MTKSEAKELYEYYSQLAKKLMDAKLKLLDGEVKSYTIADRTLTRFDMDVLSDELDKAISKREQYASMLNGRTARKAVGIVLRDI